jgi:hypothetical protein
MSTYAKRTLEPRIVTELTRIREIKKKRFSSRHEIMAEINFPTTNPARIVIKSNEKGTGFMRNHYHDEYCSPYISKKEFDGVVDKVSLIIGNEYSRKRKLDTKGMSSCTKLLFMFAFLQIIAFTIFFLIYIEGESKNAYKIVTIVTAGVGFAIGLAIMFYNFFSPYEEMLTFDQMVFRKVNEHLVSINEQYRQRNLEWILIPCHYWMELRMLDKNEKDYDPHTANHKGESTLRPPADRYGPGSNSHIDVSEGDEDE